jgi:UbiD family decarboxylase
MSLRAAIFASEDTITVEEEVSTRLEATRIMQANPRSPIHFLNLGGKEAVANIWADRSRMARAIGMAPGDIMHNLLRAMSGPMPVNEIENPPFLHNVEEDFDLEELPIPQYFPRDGGRYITSAVAISEFEGQRNLSFHRLMLLDERRMAIRLVPRHLFTMHRLAQDMGEELPVAFCVGVCPSVLLAGACSVDYGQDEMEIASALRNLGLGERAEVGRTLGGLPVPAFSEYVIEGRITSETVEEGPFVDITGTYDRVREQPVVEVDRIHHVDHPIFHLVLPGGLEHFLLMGMPREPIIFRTVRQTVPRTHDVRLTEGGCCWLHGVVSITKNKEGDGKNAIMAAFTGHPSMKRVVIVDEDVDIHDDTDVEWAIATRFQADRDLVRIDNAAGSSLDPSSKGPTSKLGLDATKPLGTDEFDRASLD